MWCPTISEQLIKSGEQLKHLRSRAPELLKALKDEEGIARLAAAMTKGTPLAYEPVHIENFNSLQISNAERYVFADGRTSSLLDGCVATHPHLSKGPRMRA